VTAPRLSAGMFLGAGLVGVHMASTHGISLAMLSSYIPATPIPGLGRVSGTAWSFTDFILGALWQRPTHKRSPIAIAIAVVVTVSNPVLGSLVAAILNLLLMHPISVNVDKCA